MSKGLPRQDEAVNRARIDKRLHERNNNQTLVPSIPHQMGPAPGSVGVSGWWAMRHGAVTGGFVDTWRARIAQVARQAFLCDAIIATTSGASANARLRITGPGGIDLVTAASTHPPGLANAVTFEWLHGLPVWVTKDIDVTLQVNVTQITTPVSDVVDIFIPYGGAVIQRTPIAATVTGLP